MKGISLVIRYVLIIILTVAIIVFAFINVASSTILSKQYVLAKLEETNYYEGIYKEIQSNFEKYIGQSGLDEDIMQDIITKDKVVNDVNIMISNIYDGTDKSIDTDEIKTNLNNKIAETTSISTRMTNAQKKSIETFVNTICNEYKQTMVHTQYEKDINNVYNKVQKYATIGRQACLIIIAVSIILIFVICYKRILKAISSIGISAISSGVFYIAVNIFIHSKIRIDTITILNSIISNSLREILNNIISQIENYGYILSIIGIVLVILGNLIDSMKNNKKEEN